MATGRVAATPSTPGESNVLELGRKLATVELRVQDDGVGIKAERASGRAMRGKQRGLGLASMQERVALLGGSVRVTARGGNHHHGRHTVRLPDECP